MSGQAIDAFSVCWGELQNTSLYLALWASLRLFQFVPDELVNPLWDLQFPNSTNKKTMPFSAGKTG
ncbi:hypothetical protein GCM10027098_19000 [Bowmanella dokdonensis]